MFEQPAYLGMGTAGWVAALKSSDPLERRLAAHALAEIGGAAREAVPALTEALRDPVSFVRVWAAAARVAGWRHGVNELARARALRTLLLADGSRTRRIRSPAGRERSTARSRVMSDADLCLLHIQLRVDILDAGLRGRDLCLRLRTR
jgi:hypothetical protein